MQEHQFDIGFFMNPHMQVKTQEKMHDIHKKCVSKCQAKHEPGAACNETVCPDPPDEYRERNDVKDLWNAVHGGLGSKLYQVEEWDWGGEALPLELFHADEAHAIQSFDIFADKFCNVNDNCKQQASNLGGHQCQPGNVIQLSER